MKKISLKAAAFTAAISFVAGTLLSVTDTIGALNIKGDVNGDGLVNVMDFIELKAILLGEDSGNRSETGKTETLNETPEVSVTLSDPDYFPDTPDREQLITSADEYETYLNEININELVIPLLLKDAPDFKNNVLFFITRKTKNHIFSQSSCTIDSTTVDVTLSSREGPACEHLITVTVPKSIYTNQSIKCTRTSDVEPNIFTQDPEDIHIVYKPVIYLYPEETTDINVKLTLDGDLVCTYPEYPENGWNVTAEPDSLLCDSDGNEYSYLFWEGDSDYNWDMSEGFVVKGEDTVSFLKEKLSYLGLTPKEYNDFIVFWLPKMQNNKYNLISFQTELYEQYAKLDITPEPDCIQRVFMAYKALDEYCEIPEQNLESFERHGYSVIEWGGTEIK